MYFLYKFLSSLEPKNNINILMYHGFIADSNSTGMANYHGKHLKISKFREQVAYLKENYNIISLEQLISYLHKKQQFPARSVVITMDDGYRSNYTLAFPVLEELRAPASIFVTTDFVDKKEFLWFDRLEYAINTTQKEILEFEQEGEKFSYSISNMQEKKEADQGVKMRLKRLSVQKRNALIAQMEDQLDSRLSFQRKIPQMYAPLEWNEIIEMAGSNFITIGNHTAAHAILTTLDARDIKMELITSKARIEEHTRKACDLFSYPNGGIGDFDGRTKKILQEAGFRSALTTIIGDNNSNSNVFELKRLNLHNDGDFMGFLRTMSTVCRFLRGIKNANFYGD